MGVRVEFVSTLATETKGGSEGAQTHRGGVLPRGSATLWGQATKCMWWMPWRSQAMKDVAACEKLRGAGKRALIRRCPNGETRPTVERLSRARSVRVKATCPSGRGEAGRTLNGGSPPPEYIGRRELTR